MSGSEVRTPPAVRERLIALDPPALLGGRCDACDGWSFPVESACAHCGAPDPNPRPLATTGRIYSYTVARFAAPGYLGPVPYGVGVVELADGIRVASTLLAEDLDDLRIGDEVAFRLLEVETAAGPVGSYAFERVGA